MNTKRWTAVLLACGIVGCSSGGGGGGEDDAASTATSSTSVITPTSAPQTPTTAAARASTTTSSTVPDAADAIEALGAVIGMELGMSGFVEPEQTSADEAFAGLPTRGRKALATLSDDPFDQSIAPEDAELLFSAYLDCVQPQALRNTVVLSVVSVIDEPMSCTSEAWDGLLTAELVAASLAWGYGLSDIPSDIAEDLADAAARCGPDQQWWIDDVDIEVSRGTDLSATQVTCLATEYVQQLGVAEVIRLRILGVPPLVVPADHVDSVQFRESCGVEPTVLPSLELAPGVCVTGFGGTQDMAVADCEGSHNGEVVTMHDLTLEFATWPGSANLRMYGAERCRADLEELSPPDQYGVGWNIPTRAPWEAGQRELTCLLVRGDNESWTGPSDVVPVATTSTSTTSTTSTTTTTAPPSTLATGETLPPGAKRFVTADELSGVGACIWRAAARPGQADLDRASYEVPCDVPHQVEFFHFGELDGGPAAPYPSEAEVVAQAEPMCELAFAAYVGTTWERSRLNYVYFSPSPDGWAQGDRGITCFLVGSQIDELFTHSMRDSRE